MANIDILVPILIDIEGGFVNDPADHGGATKYGVTLATWKNVGYDKDGDGDIDWQDIKILTPQDFKKVLRLYWDRWRGDQIVNQSVANILVDWAYQSGSWGIKIPQRILGVKKDGIVGSDTVAAVNSSNQKELFDKIFAARTKFFNDIVKNDNSQEKFLKGWLNRISRYKYGI